MLNAKEIALVFLICFTFQSHGFLYEEYYWQDYEGEIPPYAYPGGQDAGGKPIYIGQVLYGSKLLPAKIYPGDRKAYFAWGIEVSVTKDIKILCTKHPENFKWVSTKKDEMHKLINQRLVKGGWEPAYDLYIGRAFHNLQTLVGRIRVFGVPTSNLGLYLSSDGKEVILNNFEVLTYAPETAGTDIRYCDKRVIILPQ